MVTLSNSNLRAAFLFLVFSLGVVLPSGISGAAAAAADDGDIRRDNASIETLINGELSVEGFLAAAHEVPFSINPDFCFSPEQLESIHSYEDLRRAYFSLAKRGELSPSHGSLIADYDKARSGRFIRALNRPGFWTFNLADLLFGPLSSREIPFFLRLAEFPAQGLTSGSPLASKLRMLVTGLCRYGIPFVIKSNHSLANGGLRVIAKPTEAPTEVDGYIALANQATKAPTNNPYADKMTRGVVVELKYQPQGKQINPGYPPQVRMLVLWGRVYFIGDLGRQVFISRDGSISRVSDKFNDKYYGLPQRNHFEQMVKKSEHLARQLGAPELRVDWFYDPTGTLSYVFNEFALPSGPGFFWDVIATNYGEGIHNQVLSNIAAIIREGHKRALFPVRSEQHMQALRQVFAGEENLGKRASFEALVGECLQSAHQAGSTPLVPAGIDQVALLAVEKGLIPRKVKINDFSLENQASAHGLRDELRRFCDEGAVTHTINNQQYRLTHIVGEKPLIFLNLKLPNIEQQGQLIRFSSSAPEAAAHPPVEEIEFYEYICENTVEHFGLVFQQIESPRINPLPPSEWSSFRSKWN